MQIAGYTFRPVKGRILCGSPGIYIYIHQTTGKFFVRAMRNSRAQRGKNNYPNYLKELLKDKPSEVLLFLAEIAKDTKEALTLASRVVISHLSEKGVLYKRKKPDRNGIFQEKYTVWMLTHKKTGAVYYFEEIKGVPVEAKVSQRLLTFNNYVLKDLVHANRVMHYFVKQFGLTDIGHWDLTDLNHSFETEHEALFHITQLSRDHFVKEGLVLNRINNIDSLYYRNTMLKLSHLTVVDYLQLKAA